MTQPNYKNGRKNNWRRYCFNECISRVHDKKNALCIYLPGKNDLDRAVALEKGVNRLNLIAVDRDEENVKRIRESGGLAINGTLQSALASWPDDWLPDIILADFQCGMEPSIALFRDILFRRMKEGCVVLVNLQRGRDTYSDLANQWTDVIHGNINALKMRSKACHRGIAFVGDFAATITGLAEMSKNHRVNGGELFLHLQKKMNPCFPAPYISSKNTMDSVIFTNPLRPLYSRSEYKKHVTHKISVEDLSSQISAIRAVRTMRITGRLK